MALQADSFTHRAVGDSQSSRPTTILLKCHLSGPLFSNKNRSVDASEIAESAAAIVSDLIEDGPQCKVLGTDGRYPLTLTGYSGWWILTSRLLNTKRSLRFTAGPACQKTASHLVLKFK